ncbi:MAG: CDP-diacylglycerol--glycerol-3-phosphate 3-phosphatidyltransferase [Nitrososphaerota archaeon]
MLNRFRELFARALTPMALALARAGLRPLHVTLLSLLLALLALPALLGLLRPALPLAALLLLGSGLLDALDGQLARALGAESRRGAFLDSTFDRLSEGAIYIGLAAGGWVPAYLATLALLLSLMVSYVRARAEGLGVQLKGVGFAERAERLLILSLSLLLGYPAPGAVLVALLSALALAQRIWAALKQL